MDGTALYDGVRYSGRNDARIAARPPQPSDMVSGGSTSGGIGET